MVTASLALGGCVTFDGKSSPPTPSPPLQAPAESQYAVAAAQALLLAPEELCLADTCYAPLTLVCSETECKLRLQSNKADSVPFQVQATVGPSAVQVSPVNALTEAFFAAARP